MHAEIINIGDELLIGQVTNTNASWMARQFTMAGISVRHITVVADSHEAILQSLEAAAKRSEVVFITGGLGPTKDDISKKVLAAFFNAALVMNEDALEDVKLFFEKRGKGLTDLNRAQALVPEGCEVIRNKNGTAPALWMKKGKIIFISLPGVPHEMRSLITDEVLPRLRSRYKLPAIYHATVLTQGLGEAVLAERLSDWENSLKEKNISLAYLPQPGIVRLRLSARGKEMEKLKDEVSREIKNLEKAIGDYIFGKEIYGEEEITLQKIIWQMLKERRETVSFAESCTGGYISSMLTSIPGASEVFAGSVICYSNDSKINLLDIPAHIIEQYGAVSEQCALQMAEKVRAKFNTTYGLSVSGIAGPGGGTTEKPVGMVWIGWCDESSNSAKQFLFGDNRLVNINVSAVCALNLLRKLLLSKGLSRHQKS